MKKKQYTLEDMKRIGFPNNLLLKYDFLKFTKPITKLDIDTYLSKLDNVNELDIELFELRYIGVFGIKEIAEQYNMPVGGVVCRVDKVTDRLMRMLKANNVVDYKDDLKSNSRFHIGLV